MLLFFASIINCITFYCFFGERLSKFNLVGVFFMCCGLACIGVAAALNKPEDVDENIDTGGRSPLLNGFLSLVIGFGGPVCISSQQLVIRKFSKIYKGIDQGIDSSPVRGLLYTFFIPALS